MNTTITTILSVIAGGIITYLIAKWQMKKNRIDHYFINSYDIGKGLTDIFPELQIHYGNEVLSKNVQVIIGGFRNTGRNDISENGKKERIKIVLPKGCVVKDVKLSSLENGLVVEHVKMDENKNEIIEKNEIVFQVFGLFKTKEHFEYSAIIEVPENELDIESNVEFVHRIANTDEIKTPKQSNLKNLIYFLLMSFFVMIFSAALIGFLYSDVAREQLFRTPMQGVLLIILIIISIIAFSMTILRMLDSKQSKNYS